MYEAAANCKDRSGSRNKLGTPFCNARRILLRHEARDESSARNSVSCKSLATLRRYGTPRYAVALQVCTHLRIATVPDEQKQNKNFAEVVTEWAKQEYTNSC
jgi:hypothetical protein